MSITGGGPGELGERGRELLAALAGRVEGEVEVYEKRGRSRRFELGPLGESFEQASEAGWAVRAGDDRRSWFAAGAGEAPERLTPPPAGDAPLRLPPPRPAPAWSEPADLAAPLASEAEGRGLLLGLGRELASELGAARLVAARLDDGASESALVSSLGVTARGRARSAALRLVARRGQATIEAEFVARSTAGLKPLAMARRLADRLTVLAAGDGRESVPATARLLLAGPVAARLLEAFAPRLVGAGSWAARRIETTAGRAIAASGVTVTDDGAAAGGLLAARWDDEGVPTGATTLIADGELVTPLLAWWEPGAGSPPAGCSRRPGWRDLPRHGPTELSIARAPGNSVADLLADLRLGAYLIATEGGIQVAADGERFVLAVSGYAIENGRATRALGACRLHGSLSAWMLGIVARARDLDWVPGAALFGAPTMLVEGLELETTTAVGE